MKRATSGQQVITQTEQEPPEKKQQEDKNNNSTINVGERKFAAPTTAGHILQLLGDALGSLKCLPSGIEYFDDDLLTAGTYVFIKNPKTTTKTLQITLTSHQTQQQLPPQQHQTLPYIPIIHEHQLLLQQTKRKYDRKCVQKATDTTAASPSSLSTELNEELNDSENEGEEKIESTEEQLLFINEFTNEYAEIPELTIHEINDILETWLGNHIDYPYPTIEEFYEFMKQTGLNISQLYNWFGRAKQILIQKQYDNANAESWILTQFARNNHPIITKIVTGHEFLETFLQQHTDNPNSEQPKELEQLKGLSCLKPKSATTKTNTPQKTAQKTSFRRETTEILETWLGRNLQNPYISPEERNELSKQTGLHDSQLRNWFSYARSNWISKQEDGTYILKPIASKNHPIIAKASKQAIISPQTTTTTTLESNSTLNSNPISASTNESFVISKQRLPEELKKVLQIWLGKHLNEPYPSRKQMKRWKKQFVDVSSKQIQGWFANARKNFLCFSDGKWNLTSTARTNHPNLVNAAEEFLSTATTSTTFVKREKKQKKQKDSDSDSDSDDIATTTTPEESENDDFAAGDEESDDDNTATEESSGTD